MHDEVKMNAERQPVVQIKDGGVYADSRDVAAFFAKRHDNVLRDIREMVRKEAKLALLNFEEKKINDLTGETTSHYEMDRDGFTLLAMGFTGDKALKWKLRYIEAFNAMEAELRRRHETLPAASGPVLTDADKKLLFGTMTGIIRREVEAPLKRAITDLTEQNRHLWKAIRHPTSAVALNAEHYIEVGGVYRLAGLEPSGLPKQQALSGRISRSLDAHCKRVGVAPRATSIGCKDVTHWPQDTVVEWLAAAGHEMIRRHIEANRGQARTLTLVASAPERTEV